VTGKREQVVEFLRSHVRAAAQERGREISDLPESFNFMDADLVDSLGFVHLVQDVEGQFGIAFDLADADPEQMVTIGGLADLAVQAASAH
jgi:acyl carrier protein